MLLVSVIIGSDWKWRFFGFARMTYDRIAIRHDFFPAFLLDPATLQFAYVGCLAAVVAALALMRHRRPRTSAIGVAGLAMTGVMLHQGSYNDMTFVTGWWALVLAVWFSSRMGIDPPALLMRKAGVLSRGLVSIVLLGGAVGKWTGEYWSGQVLYEI